MTTRSHVLLLLVPLLFLGASRTPSWAAAVRADDASASEAGLVFRAYDLVVDSGQAPLAAWQVELSNPTGTALLVGVEGGEPGPYAEPAHHDPRALQSARVVLAHFTLGEAPRGATRVARLHFAIEARSQPEFRCELVAAADPEGRALDADVVLSPHLPPNESDDPEERR